MPTYQFKNHETGEVYDKNMRMSDLDEYLNQNKAVGIHHTADTLPAVCDPYRIGVTGVDPGFRDVLKQIHKNTPGSQIDKSVKI